MAEKKEDLKQAPAVKAAEQPTDERPNRSAYAKMFNEDYPDVDFEDKEARYGKMVEDRQHYKELSNAGRGLSSALDKNRWLGAMFQDLAENPDKDPISWMYDNGIDVQKAMEDEEYRKQVSEGLATYQRNQAEGEEKQAQREKNLYKSADNLSALGVDDEEAGKLWAKLWEEVVGPANEGEVSKETWQLIRNAVNYDGDIKNAREEAGMQARNEKVTNPLKTFGEEKVPPSFTQGSGQTAKPKQKKKSMFDEMKEWGYK